MDGIPKRHSITDARAKLPTIIADLESGGRVELTRRGKVVAVVISAEDYERIRSPRSSFADTYRAFTKRFPLDAIGADRSFLDELRDEDPGRSVTV